ncbi:hypothetical protein BH09MYX1_BH09MYX1_12910 [soil metagenome]
MGRRFFVLTLVAGALVGCPASLKEVCDDNACVAPDGGAVPPGCDLSKDLKDSPACIDELVGVFVSPTGADTNDGSKRKPFATLSKALSQNGKARIYVCEGTFIGSTAITKAVAIYGGLKCDFTAGGARPTIVGDGPDFALRITGSGAALVDVVVQAQDAAKPSESSVALAVVSAQSVSLTRVRLVAGKGQAGADGIAAPYVFPPQAALDGKPGTGTSGGLAASITCPGGATTVGGKGGDNGLDGQAGQPSGAGGAAGTFAGCGSNLGGGAGATGASAVAAGSSTTLGVIGASWSPVSGARGSDGAPGQGGGGGGGKGGGGGGGGGAGGCGGAGGAGGAGGGASIALLAVGSSISIFSSELVTSFAGKGGNGVAGQAAQVELGGAGVPASGACGGGVGGAGGAGGAGAGGAGGVSVAVIYKGPAPSLDVTTTTGVTLGTKGAKGTGGVPGTNDGPEGVAQAVFELK